MAYSYLDSIIRKHITTLSETESQIASYFKEIGGDVINKTLANLSEEIGVSEASIYKFVRKIGFKGFQDFKISVASNLRKKEEKNQHLTAFADISKQDSPYIVAQKVINSNQESLKSLIQSLDDEQLSQALNLLYDAKSIHFFGQGASSIVAFDSYHKFIRSHFHCNYIFDSHIQLSYATKLDQNDCVFLFSHSGETIETIEIARILKKNHAKIISMTGNPRSELVDLSDIAFVIYSEESAFRSEALTARILYLTIIDILYVNVMYREEQKNKQSINNIRQALSITKKREDFK